MNTLKHRNSLTSHPLHGLFNDILGVDTNTPMVNIKETGSEFILEVSAPGHDKDNFDINIENNVLIISSSVENNKSENGENYTRREFYKSSFSRSFTLPKNANSESINATYENGILTLSIPKSEPVKKSKQIKVK
jgi:HSP20 family protein